MNIHCTNITCGISFKETNAEIKHYTLVLLLPDFFLFGFLDWDVERVFFLGVDEVEAVEVEAVDPKGEAVLPNEEVLPKEDVAVLPNEEVLPKEEVAVDPKGEAVEAGAAVLPKAGAVEREREGVVVEREKGEVVAGAAVVEGTETEGKEKVEAGAVVAPKERVEAGVAAGELKEMGVEAAGVEREGKDVEVLGVLKRLGVVENGDAVGVERENDVGAAAGAVGVAGAGATCVG